MITLPLIEPDGTKRFVDAAVGMTLMQAAVCNSVAGIVGSCRSTCACATCHIVVSTPDAAFLPPVSEQEGDMLESALALRFAGSRLGCRIAITENLEGLVVRVPSRPHSQGLS